MKPVLFIDLDGTLLLPFERLYKIHIKACSLTKIRPLTYRRYVYLKRRKIIEQNIVNVPAKIFVEYDKVRLQLLETWSYLKLDKLSNGAIDFLKSAEKTHRIVLLTKRKNKKNLFKQLNFFGVKSFFDEVLNVENKARAIKTHFRDWGSALLVGDTEEDVVIAKGLGIKSIVITTGMRDASILKRFKPDVMIYDLIKLRKLLEKD